MRIVVNHEIKVKRTVHLLNTSYLKFTLIKISANILRISLHCMKDWLWDFRKMWMYQIVYVLRPKIEIDQSRKCPANAENGKFRCKLTGKYKIFSRFWILKTSLRNGMGRSDKIGSKRIMSRCSDVCIIA